MSTNSYSQDEFEECGSSSMYYGSFYSHLDEPYLNQDESYQTDSNESNYDSAQDELHSDESYKGEPYQDKFCPNKLSSQVTPSTCDEASTNEVFANKASTNEASTNEASTNEASTNEGSIVCKYFKKAKDSTICDICSSSLVYTNGTTSNLLRHLKKHKCKVPELNKSNIKTGPNVLEMLKARQREPFDQQKFTDMVIQCIVKHNRSFQIIENDELRSIFTYLEPKIDVPSADLVKQHIMSNSEEEREQLQKKLQEVPGRIAITTDIWTTSTNEKSFMAVTIHYLNQSCKIKYVLLDFIFMKNTHTGIAIANAMKDCLQKNGIFSKIISITCDNASANVKFLRDFANSIHIAGFRFDHTQQSIWCFNHILNLAVQCILRVVGSEIDKLRGLIKSIRGSQKRRKKLKLSTVLRPILDIPTRWNSTFYMCERALKLRTVLDAISFAETELRQYVLAENECKIIERLVKVLLPFADATVFMSLSEYPTLSMSIPFYYSLFESLEETRQNDDIPEWLKQGCKAASNKLLEYCQKTSVLHISSVVLDPRLKIRYFEELRWSSKFIDQIKDIIKDKYEDEYAPPPPNQETANTIAEPSQSIISRIYKCIRIEPQSEFDTYLMTPIVDQHTDILAWWQINESSYPNLAKFARDCLSIPATSVPSEQAFSISGDMLTNKRNRLDGKTVRAAMCLKSWWKELAD